MRTTLDMVEEHACIKMEDDMKASGPAIESMVRASRLGAMVVAIRGSTRTE